MPVSDNLITKVPKATSPAQTVVPKPSSPTVTIVGKSVSPAQTIVPKSYDLSLVTEDYITLMAEDGLAIQLEG